MPLAEALTILSCRPTWTLEQAQAWAGEDEDLIINIQTPVPIGSAIVQVAGLRARAYPTTTAAVRHSWADHESVAVWGQIDDWRLLGSNDGRWGWSAAAYLEIG